MVKRASRTGSRTAANTGSARAERPQAVEGDGVVAAGCGGGLCARGTGSRPPHSTPSPRRRALWRRLRHLQAHQLGCPRVHVLLPLLHSNANVVRQQQLLLRGKGGRQAVSVFDSCPLGMPLESCRQARLGGRMSSLLASSGRSCQQGVASAPRCLVEALAAGSAVQQGRAGRRGRCEQQRIPRPACNCAAPQWICLRRRHSPKKKKHRAGRGEAPAHASGSRPQAAAAPSAAGY